MLLFCVFSLFILVLQSEDEEPDNDRQMEELQQDSNKKVTLHFIITLHFISTAGALVVITV